MSRKSKVSLNMYPGQAAVVADMEFWQHQMRLYEWLAENYSEYLEDWQSYVEYIQDWVDQTYIPVLEDEYDEF